MSFLILSQWEMIPLFQMLLVSLLISLNSDSNSYDTIEKMLEANKKLSTDLMYLIQAIETQLVKFKDERERNMQKMKTRDDKPPELKKKDKELMGFQKKANKLSREIDLMKRRLEGAHSDESSISNKTTIIIS